VDNDDHDEFLISEPGSNLIETSTAHAVTGDDWIIDYGGESAELPWQTQLEFWSSFSLLEVPATEDGNEFVFNLNKAALQMLKVCIYFSSNRGAESYFRAQKPRQIFLIFKPRARKSFLLPRMFLNFGGKMKTLEFKTFQHGSSFQSTAALARQLENVLIICC
jgi:hypothetical protein